MDNGNVMIQIIDAIRDYNGMTRAEYAAAIKINKTTWQNYYGNHKGLWSDDAIDRYAGIFGLTCAHIKWIAGHVEGCDDIKSAVERIMRLGILPETVEAEEFDENGNLIHKAYIKRTLYGWRCSECDHWVGDLKFKYCPWCGIPYVTKNVTKSA